MAANLFKPKLFFRCAEPYVGELRLGRNGVEIEELLDKGIGR